MRKFLTLLAATIITSNLFAGGLVTNTNQSAAWVRLPSRNASVGIDAVYYNPAGLMKLENGFYVSLSNQSIWQKREVDNNYAGPGGTFGLNDHVYKGTVNAPLFPSIYAAYKMDKFAFSLGFGPVGGGGGAEFKTGLPSFEMSPSDLVPSLAGSPYLATKYKLDAYFKGTSTILGYQGGISYKINDKISIAAGLRYITAKNTYEGHLNNISVFLTGSAASLAPYGLTSNDWNRGDNIMKAISTGLSSLSTNAHNLDLAGLGAQTYAFAKTAGAITATQEGLFEGALASLGYPITTPISQSTLIYSGGAVKYNATSTLLADQSADVAQTGSGITPLFSVNISPSEKLNIAIKYEMATKIELKNKTTKDFLIGYQNSATTGLPDITKPITMFPDGEKIRNDMPAMLALGVDYKFSTSLKGSIGMNYYFDKTANYGHTVDGDLNSATPAVPISNKNIIANNGISIDAGLEYNISEKFLVSAGYSWANQGVNDKYQSDINYGLGTQTLGAGGAYNFSKNIQLNLGVSYTIYKQASITVDHIFSATGANIQSTETYKKNAFIVGIGLDFKF